MGCDGWGGRGVGILGQIGIELGRLGWGRTGIGWHRAG